MAKWNENKQQLASCDRSNQVAPALPKLSAKAGHSSFSSTSRHSLEKEGGLSLIGVLIGTFLLVGSALAMTQLMGRTERTVGISLDRFVAANLAREGLELVQAYRDSNWFALSAAAPAPGTSVPTWTRDICPDDGAHEFTIEHDGAGSTGIFINPGGNPQLYQDANGYWSHTQRAGAAATRYERIVRVDCAQHEAGDSGQDGGVSVVPVSSIVRWTRDGQPREVEITERLYDWYR